MTHLSPARPAGSSPCPPQLRTSVEDGRAVLALTGELDLVGVKPVVDCGTHLLSEYGRLVLDLSRVSFFDASGIRVLVMLRQAVGREGRLSLRAPSPAVLRVLELLGMHHCFPVEAPSAPRRSCPPVGAPGPKQ